MLNRRTLIAAAAVAALAPGLATAQTWQSKFPELVLALVPAENASGTIDRYKSLTEYLAKELGTKVTLRVAADYAAVIEGQKAGQIHLGNYGPGSYVLAHRVSGGTVEAFTTNESQTGATGYFSVIWVKKDSPYQKLEDLKGKNLGLVDANSTSGNFAPRYFMSKAGIDVDGYFKTATYTGSHENAIIALSNGTVDGATNWWNAPGDSNFDRMVKKGMVKGEDFRLLWKSEPLAGSPWAYLTTIPAEGRKAIADAFYNMHTKAPELVAKMSDGQDRKWVPVSHKDYADQEKMNDFIDALRKKRVS